MLRPADKEEQPVTGLLIRAESPAKDLLCRVITCPLGINLPLGH